MTTESVGPFLKQAREAQGLSLEQVASLTRIQSKFLQALEDEDFADLPEQVFTRGFVRTYARSLGMNEEDVLRRFSESSSEFYARGQQEQHQVQLKLEEERRGKLNRNVVIVVTGAVLLGLVFLLPKRQVTLPSSPSQNTTVPTPTAPLPKQETQTPPPAQETGQPDVASREEPAPVVPASVPANPTRVAKSTDAVTPGSAPVSPTANPMLLELEATQLTWVVVKSDEDEPHEALLQPGQRATWEATSQFTLTLGNAGGVVVRLNGESRGPFGKPGQVVREVVIRK